MAVSEAEDFLYHLKKYMEYTTEMRASYEHLSDNHKKTVVDSSPTKQGPKPYQDMPTLGHDELFDQF
ncbi:hypothetical protein SAMN05192559_103119 [Halobacillus karajensis]|uniref:hypothetical protein n=1 Tax=Halobacillus karajensis TaxID=195088 RepID=UPI0008A76C35|nr:hypothetical protein [Halobacillus karajensis]SEH69568.1 hypothetical protein SAMN05192559_103119 [Halobacillus karajensis]